MLQWVTKGGENMNIGYRIKQRRKELGMTADKLGELLGKDRSTIYRYEKGDIENLPLDILEPIATVLHTTPAYLMGWDIADKKGGVKNPPANLTEGETEWLKLYHRISEETREMLITSLDEFDELTPEQQQLALDLIRVALKNRR